MNLNNLKKAIDLQERSQAQQNSRRSYQGLVYNRKS
jgi:hypothetical protein